MSSVLVFPCLSKYLAMNVPGRESESCYSVPRKGIRLLLGCSCCSSWNQKIDDGCLLHIFLQRSDLLLVQLSVAA